MPVSMKARSLLSDHFHQHALAPPPVELTVKNLFPRPKIQLSIRNRHQHFPPHQLPFDMRVAVVLAGFVVAIRCLLRREPFEKGIVILKQSPSSSLI